MTSIRGCHTAGDNLLTDIYTDGTKRRLRYKSEIPLLPTDDEYIYIFNERQTRTPTISETVPDPTKMTMTTFNHLQPLLRDHYCMINAGQPPGMLDMDCTYNFVPDAPRPIMIPTPPRDDPLWW